MHLARTYWGIPSLSFEIGGQYHLPPSACGLRGSGWYWPPISQDSDGIPQYVLARCMVFLQYHKIISMIIHDVFSGMETNRYLLVLHYHVIF